MVQLMDKTALCHRPHMQRRPILELKVKTLGATGKVPQARWVVNNTKSVRSREAVVAKAGVNEIMRSDRRTEVVTKGLLREASQAKSRSEVPTVSVVKKGVVKGKAADDMVNEKANVQVVKEASDPAGRIVNHAKEPNLVRASLIVVLATTAGHQDQDEKSATDAAEVEVEAQETTRESEPVILQTSHMAT